MTTKAEYAEFYAVQRENLGNRSDALDGLWRRIFYTSEEALREVYGAFIEDFEVELDEKLTMDEVKERVELNTFSPLHIQLSAEELEIRYSIRQVLLEM